MASSICKITVWRHVPAAAAVKRTGMWPFAPVMNLGLMMNEWGQSAQKKDSLFGRTSSDSLQKFKGCEVRGKSLEIAVAEYRAQSNSSHVPL